MTVGTGRHIWNPGALFVSGTGAPIASQIISAQLTYGALGTCQGGTLKLARLPAVGCRDQLWQVGMDGQGMVFAGIVDQATQGAGELADVSLLAPHRQTLDALGVAPGSPYRLQTFGPVGVPDSLQPYERLSDVLGRALDPYPNADYGVGPELTAAVGLPESADYRTYTLGSDALSIRSMGYSVPDYVTDAVFDPGEGWQKYIYRRAAPGYVLRRTGQATANPAVVTVTEALALTYKGAWFSTPAPVFDSAARKLNEAAAYYTFSIPEQSSTKKPQRASLVLPYRPDTIPEKKKLIVSAFLIRDSEGKALSAVETTYGPERAGQELAVNFELPLEVVQPGGTFTLLFGAGFYPYAGGDAPDGTLAFHPPRLTLESQVPNLAGLVLPDGWEAPFSFGPVFEVRLRGWHIPPLKITGLPGVGEQMAAGATVTYNRQEVTTTITTMAWPYAGQRRGNR